jgi:hypothetical protein
MEITYEQLTGRFLTYKEMIAGTSVTYRQIDYARRTGIITATHAMNSSFDRKKPVKVWELTGELGSGTKVLWEVDHFRTRHAQRLIVLLDAGVELPLATVLLRSMTYGVIENGKLVDTLHDAIEIIDRAGSDPRKFGGGGPDLRRRWP